MKKVVKLKALSALFAALLVLQMAPVEGHAFLALGYAVSQYGGGSLGGLAVGGVGLFHTALWVAAYGGPAGWVSSF